MKLLVGLGNPGSEYAETRHNAGFRVIDMLARRLGVQVDKPFLRALVGRGEINEFRVILAKPLTYMNASGEAVAALLRWYKLTPADLLVVYDDMDLPPGVVRIRPKGGSGGHRGLASVVEHVGTKEFARLRVGIGKPASGDPVNWVLGKFAGEEKKVIEPVLERAVEAICTFVTRGINEAMNRYNS